MKKSVKALMLSLCLIFGLFFHYGTVDAAANTTQYFNTSYLSDSEKSEIATAAEKGNLSQKISGLYPGEQNFVLSEPLKLQEVDDNADFLAQYKSDRLTKYYSNSYRIIQAIKSETGNILGAVLYNRLTDNDLESIQSQKDSDVKAEELQFYNQNKDTWYVAFVGAYCSVEGMKLITDFPTIQKKLSNVGIDKIQNISLLDTANGTLPLMVYVQTEDREYSLPVASDMVAHNYQTGSIYKLNDIVNSQIDTAKKYQSIPASERPLGGTNVNLKELTPVTRFNHIVMPILFIVMPSLTAVIALVLVCYRFRASIRKKLARKDR